MDGKGRWLDNVYVERLWRSLKQEEVYRRAYETVAEARKGIADYLRYFNEERPHQGLDNRTPDDVFYKRKPLPKAAIKRWFGLIGQIVVESKCTVTTLFRYNQPDETHVKTHTQNT